MDIFNEEENISFQFTFVSLSSYYVCTFAAVTMSSVLCISAVVILFPN